MSEIAQHHRRRRLLASAGNVIASPGDSSGEFERLGNTIAQFGINLVVADQKIEAARVQDELADAQLQMAERFEKYRNEQDFNNTDKWRENLDNNQKFDDITSGLSPKALEKFDAIKDRELFRQDRVMSTHKRSVDTQNIQRNYRLNLARSEELVSNQLDHNDYRLTAESALEINFGVRVKENEELTPENLEVIEDYDDPKFPNEELRVNEAMAWLEITEDNFNANQREIFKREVLEQALVSPDGLKDIERINPADYGIGLTDDDITKLKSNYTTQKNAIDRQAEKELVENQDKNNRESWVSIRRGDLTDPTVIENMVLNDNLSIEAGKSLVKLIGTGPADDDDNQALFDAGQITNKVRDSEITAAEGFEQLQKLSTKLTDQTMDTKINQLSAAEKPEDPINSPQAERYLLLLGNLVIGDETEPSADQMLFYDKAYRAFSDYITKNPDATPEQLSKFYSDLVQPFMSDWFGKNWEKLILQLPDTGSIQTETQPNVTDKGFLNFKKPSQKQNITKTATNPKTGEKMGWNGKEWVTLQ